MTGVKQCILSEILEESRSIRGANLNFEAKNEKTAKCGKLTAQSETVTLHNLTASIAATPCVSLSFAD